MKKRVLTILMIGLLSISMIACGKDSENITDEPNTTVSVDESSEEQSESSEEKVESSEEQSDEDSKTSDDNSNNNVLSAKDIIDAAFTFMDETENLSFITQQVSEIVMTAADFDLTEEQLEQATGSKDAIMHNTIEIKTCYDNKNDSFYNELDITVDVLGQVQNKHTEQYVISNGNSYDSYTYMETTDNWVVTKNDTSVTTFEDYAKATDLEIVSEDDNSWVIKGAIKYSDINNVYYNGGKDDYVSVVYIIEKDGYKLKSIQLDTDDANPLYLDGSTMSLSMLITIVSVNETPVEFDSSIKESAIDSTEFEN